MIAMTINTQAQPPIPTTQPQTTNTSTSSSEEITNLAGELHNRESRSASWNKWYLRLVFLTAILGILAAAAAIATFLIQNRANEEQRSVVTAQRLLTDAKDRKLAFDLKERDFRIAQLDLERVKLLEQIAEMGPRINLLTGNRRERLRDALLSFKGQKVLIGASWPDRFFPNETTRFSKALANTLREAKWDVLDENAVIVGSDRGFGISVGIGPNPTTATRVAAKALIDALKHVPLAVDEIDSGHLRQGPQSGDTVLICVSPHSFGATTPISPLNLFLGHIP
jgi:hypothetical protein